MALHHWLQLALTDGIGPVLTRRLIDAAGSPEAACGATTVLLKQIDGIGSAKANRIRGALDAAARAAPLEIERATAMGVTLISRDDQQYPALLRSIPDPPPVLYVRGVLEPRDLNAIAIVGSRKCSYYGREQAERFGALLAEAGLTVISGGARGIDSAAHRGAMRHPHGRTIAVLGCGVDVVYPPENASLFAQIADGRGAIVSEYPLGTAPLRENFPRRNRIVSGMSRGVVVIEADEQSGALITARQAVEDHGRPVFALPGRVDSPMSAGPHRLIREGAVLTEGLGDIVENLGPLPADAHHALAKVAVGEPEAPPKSRLPEPAITSRPLANISDRQRKILSTFDGQALGVDELVQRSGLGAAEVLQDLTFLSLKGMLKRVDGQTYALTRSGPA